jgi:hypothetical protein
VEKWRGEAYKQIQVGSECGKVDRGAYKQRRVDSECGKVEKGKLKGAAPRFLDTKYFSFSILKLINKCIPF